MPDVIINGMEMRSACSGETDCFALDEHGDYPMCRITGETRGYTFPIRERRMDNCPLSPAPEWISVEERLPGIPKGAPMYYWREEDIPADEYIVMIEGAEIPTSLYWTGDEWADIYPLGEDTYHVTHWMPLPEPPEGGTDDA